MWGTLEETHPPDRLHCSCGQCRNNQLHIIKGPFRGGHLYQAQVWQGMFWLAYSKVSVYQTSQHLYCQ